MSEKGEAPDAESTGVPPARWGLGEAAVAFLAGTILSVLLGGLAQAATGYHPGQGKAIPLGVTAVSLVGLWAGLGGGAVFASRARGSGRLADDLGLRVRWPLDPALGVVAGLVSSLVLIPLLYLPFEQIVPNLQQRLQAPAKQDTAGANGAFAITALVLLLAVGAPIVEELFFRGLLQRSLARRFGPVAAVATSSALFGLAHFEPLQLPALILFGIVLGGLAQRTGRLGPGIFAHATFNALTVLTFTLSH
jgi:uncharacterized protein